MRACSVYNGLILCRRHCFTIVAHDWKFWQMYFAWKIVLKLYMCICIVLWMYFLILTPELSANFYSSCLLYCLFEEFPGTPPAVVQVSPTCTVLYAVCLLCVFIYSWEKHEHTLGEMHFYLFKSPQRVSDKKYLLPPPPRPPAMINVWKSLSSWWNCYQFCTLS